MEIIIKTVKNRRDNQFIFNVFCKDKSTGNLEYAEMIGLISALTMPEVRPTQLLLSKKQHQEINKYLKQ